MKQFPVADVVEFCVSVAEENLRKSRDQEVEPRSFADIAEWVRSLLNPSL